MTYRQYVNLCVGYKDKERKEEFFMRRLNYDVVRGWADPKSLPSIYQFWPIDGEPMPKIRKISKRKLMKLDAMFRNLGKR